MTQKIARAGAAQAAPIIVQPKARLAERRTSVAAPVGLSDPLLVRRDGTRTDLSAVPASTERGVLAASGEPEVDTPFGRSLSAANGVGALLRGVTRLPDPIRLTMESRFGEPLGSVRVYDGEGADFLAKAAGAHALAHGSDVVFAKGRYAPGTVTGDELIAHELAHVVEQRRSGRPRMQRLINPKDVSSEMVGQTFTVTKDVVVPGGKVKAGFDVVVVAWDNTKPTVSVVQKNVLAYGTIEIPKTALKPKRDAVAGIAPYEVGIAAQAVVVEAGESQLAAWNAKETKYKTPMAKAVYAAEQERLATQLEVRRDLLNTKLIEETMYNRFDAIIKKEVDAENAARRLTGANALDPNVVKAMFYTESKLGTQGQHLELSPGSPYVKTRFNLGQVIDSSASAILLMFEREDPKLIAKYKLGNLRADMAAAQRDYVALKKKPTGKLNAADNQRLADIEALLAGTENWEIYLWNYKPAGSTVGFLAAWKEFFESSTPQKNLDYEFWTHMSVQWLFAKHQPGMSWAQTVAAYNGSGARAQHYQQAVMSRAAKATGP